MHCYQSMFRQFAIWAWLFTNTGRQSAESSKEARTSFLPCPAANIITPAAPKRNSPAQAPGHTVYAIPYTKLGGLCRGRSRRGRLGGTGLSSRGGSLQGLFLRQNFPLRGPVPGKVSPGEAWRDRPLLKRRVSPRSSPSEGIFSGGTLQGLPYSKESQTVRESRSQTPDSERVRVRVVSMRVSGASCSQAVMRTRTRSALLGRIISIVA